MKDVMVQARAIIAAASAPDRLYPLRPHPDYGFCTGHLAGGEQAILIWRSATQVVILRFSSGGDYLGSESRDCPPITGPSRRRDHSDQATLDLLRAGLGFVAGPVRVRRFQDHKWRVGIFPVEESHTRFAADPMSWCEGDPAEAAEILEELRYWVEQGQFVFSCGNRYWVDADGEVFSS